MIRTSLFFAYFFMVFTNSICQITLNYDSNGNLTIETIIGNTPLAEIQGPFQACLNEQTTLIASGGGTYLWSTGANTPSIQFTAQQSQTYSVTVTAANSCETIVEHPIVVYDQMGRFDGGGG